MTEDEKKEVEFDKCEVKCGCDNSPHCTCVKKCNDDDSKSEKDK